MTDIASLPLWIDTAHALIGLALPWWLGCLLVSWALPATPSPAEAAGRRAIILGYGYLAGFLLITGLMRACDRIGLGLDPIALLIGSASLVGLLFVLRRTTSPNPVSQSRGVGQLQWSQLANWQAVVLLGLALLIATRLGTLMLEVYWRPLFPWDASMHWATKTRVWTELGQIAPFVDHATWLASFGDGVFTDNHPDYPSTIPLIQTWMNLTIGHWDDALMNLPWAGLAIAMTFGFFGQARRAGATPLAAILFCYLLVSMPQVGAQIALAGYADIFLGTTILFALMALYNWAESGARSQAVLAFGFALAAPLIKQEGLFWLLCFLPALAALWLRRTTLAVLAASSLAGVAAMLMWFPQDLVIAGHSLQELDLSFHAGAPGPLLNSLFVFGSWHLLFWLTIMLLCVRLLHWNRPWRNSLLAVALMLVSAFVLMVILFVFTVYANSMPGYTSVSRISLHLAPGVLFFCLILYLDLTEASTRAQARLHQTAE